MIIVKYPLVLPKVNGVLGVQGRVVGQHKHHQLQFSLFIYMRNLEHYRFASQLSVLQSAKIYFKNKLNNALSDRSAKPLKGCYFCTLPRQTWCFPLCLQLPLL